MRLLILLTALLGSCAPGYHAAFKKEAALLPDPPVSTEGAWKGSWKSDTNGHLGPLWCIVRPSPGEPDSHDFRYRAGWGVLRFGNYTHTTPTTRNRDGSLILNGAMALPAGLGTYKVKGKLTATTFDATYSSKHDSGSFTLRRP